MLMQKYFHSVALYEFTTIWFIFSWLAITPGPAQPEPRRFLMIFRSFYSKFQQYKGRASSETALAGSNFPSQSSKNHKPESHHLSHRHTGK